MNLYDKLPTEDKQLIKDYICEYSRIDNIPNLENTLQEWSKNKKTLYRALGNQFRVTIPIQATADKQKLFRRLQDKYEIPQSFYMYFHDLIPMRENQHIFIFQLMEYFYELGKQKAGFSQTFYDISRNLEYILSWNNIFAGHIAYFPYSSITYNHRTLKFNEGVKPLRILRKVLNFIEFPHMESFEKFCNDISYELTNKNNTVTNLVFSIHPIDFMTMSHNTCNWSSCMNWNVGCYSNGVLEMMNSNVAVVAYVESSEQDFKVNEHEIPNKSWRCLYYVHKDIICSGKAYPFGNETLVRNGLDALAKLVKKNLHWTYQYKNQQYFDMCNFSGNEDARNCMRDYGNEHNIVLYNYAAMYNDFVHDHEESYFCYRNWVPKTLKLCVSGPATCIICGKPITPISEIREKYYWEDNDFEARGSEKVCRDCHSAYYNYFTHSFYIETTVHKCTVVDLYRVYDWFNLTYEYTAHPITVALPAIDSDSLITPNEKMPQEAKDLLAETCNLFFADTIIFSVGTDIRNGRNDAIFKLLIDHQFGKNIDEVKQYFDFVKGEYIEQLPISSPISL